MRNNGAAAVNDTDRDGVPLQGSGIHVEELIEIFDLKTVEALAVMQLEPIDNYEIEEGPATARTVLAVRECETQPAGPGDVRVA